MYQKDKKMGCETIEDIKELDKLRKELAIDPNNVELLLKTGMILFDPFIDMEKARPYFEKAIELESNNPDLYFWFGYALYHDQCAYEKSKNLFESAIKLEPNRAEFHYMMFYVLWHMTNSEESGLKFLLKAIELQPEWIDPRIQHITYLIDKNKFEETRKELFEAYNLLKTRYKKTKVVGANILEKYLIEVSGGGNYKLTKSWLDGLKKKLIEKEKNGM